MNAGPKREKRRYGGVGTDYDCDSVPASPALAGFANFVLINSIGHLEMGSKRNLCQVNPT
ncbi:hypothetical protein GX51_03564 [Blastomyces parvus]|uniref:Uncharacterized protein n=1 Tax=Blastomyces parvus TaxID=2060905 RepID=A0A2B7X637_9EURO|nr:hypothetical protein GX51_03564 [Blastomyces parvus]